VRPHPELGRSSDPLTGHELWHPLTRVTVATGLRETDAAVRMLQHLHCGTLNRMLLRMTTAHIPTSGPTPIFGTLCALSTLMYWPRHRRAELVTFVAATARAALESLTQQGRGGLTTAPRSVSACPPLNHSTPGRGAFSQARAEPGRPYVVPSARPPFTRGRRSRPEPSCATRAEGSAP
jgi:hypothetical protein